MHFTEIEKQIISDTEFLKTKFLIINKIENFFEDLREMLSARIDESTFIFPPDIDTRYGKIFRGENYRLLPLVVLDYPKLFSKDDTFTFRTMFWWGNFFSSTLHLEGKSLTHYRDKIIANLPKYLDEQFYVCVNDTPWEYHYESSNYVLLNLENLHLLHDSKFIKLSKKFKLEHYNDLPNLSSDFLNTILNILSH
jgi:hypothetical protein